jgi:dTDP-glucose pyrophosphorylase
MNSTQTDFSPASAALDMSPKRDWRRSLLSADATLQQAIRSLDESAMQIVLVASPDGALIGTITDGDIRRGLLSGLDLSSPCNAIIRRSPLVVPPEMARNAVLQLMQANRIHQLPVVDKDRHLVGLHIWNELITSPQLTNMMVIMAGGQGTRLRPLTENCPKPMLPVAGKPMLEHIIERARNDGFRHFVLAIHYLGHMIEDYFGDGSGWQVRIDYVREEQPLGTAGALNLLTPRPDAPFLVSNGDVLADIRYAELLDFHLRHNATATMAVRLHEWQHPFGVVNTSGVDIVGFEEKPIIRTHINAGIYAIDPCALDSLAANERCDMPVLFARVMAQGQRAIVYPMHEPWLDIGRPLDYQQVEKGFQSNE